MKTVLACLGAATLATGKVYFSETFDDDWESRWVNSQWEKGVGRKGSVSLATGKFFKDEQDDRGMHTELVTYPDRGYYWDVSAAFDSFSNGGKQLVIQYQVKYEKDVECAGGYIKLGPKMDQTKFGEFSPFHILFGPDKCGNLRSTRRTRLDIGYNGKVRVKKMHMEYKQEARTETTKGISHLYRLVIKPDNTVHVSVDMEKLYEGSIRSEWEGFLIDDPTDIKPSTWVGEMMIDDPNGTKPDDWAEKQLVDPAASQPSDWDPEEDGEWEAPVIDNPEYKGEWVNQRIYNKKYSGYWQAKQIDNPEYADDKEVYKFEDISWVGFDLWQQEGGTIFDNIIIADDMTKADEFAAKWKERNAHEQAAKIQAVAEEKRKQEEERERAEAAAAKVAAAAAEKAANREAGRKQGFDEAKLDRIERAIVRAKANKEYEAAEAERKLEEKADQELVGDDAGKKDRAKKRQAVRRNENAFKRMRDAEEKADQKAEAEAGGSVVPPDTTEEDAKKKKEEDAKKEREAKKSANEAESKRIADAKAAIAERAAARAKREAEQEAGKAEL